jgi:hypothetical protein
MMTGAILAGFEGMFEDITERRTLRDQLLQAQKLESVGQLAAGIAHEINTPPQYIGDNIRFLKKSFAKLTTVLSIYGGLWKETCSDTVTSTSIEDMGAALQKIDIEFLLEEIPKSINDGLEGVTRVSSLVSAMKEFSHPGTKEKVAVDLNRAIQSTITVAQNEWKYVAEMETDFEPTLPLVSCLPGEFNGHSQSHSQRGSRDRGSQQRKKRRQGQDYGADSLLFDRGRDPNWRQRRGDTCGGKDQDIRPLFHHQGNRKGHRAGTRHCPVRNRGQAQWQHRLRNCVGGGYYVDYSSSSHE